MKKYTQIHPILLARSIRLWFKGYIHFPKEQNGSTIKEEEDFIIFRKVVLGLKEKQHFNQGVVLKVFFRFKRFSLNINKILSLIPIPFIIAQRGFRSKTWLFGKQTGTFHGLYEWDNAENAEQYLNSFPLKLMKRRSVPDTLKYEIIDIKNISGEL